MKYLFIIAYVGGVFTLGLLSFLCEFYEKIVYHINKNEINNTVFDYIIVGAGTSGSVLALRLSEDPNNRILLLEAGGYGLFFIDTPLVAPLLHNSIYDWKFRTTPQKNACHAFNENSCYWPSGKMFGGSGRLNHMLYTRGHPMDFREWYLDVDDFDYDAEILEYFKKSEDQVGSFAEDREFHGKRGPVIVNDLQYVSEIHDYIMEAARSLNMTRGDVNGRFNTGFVKPQVNIKDGYRYSTAHYLWDNKRPNLSIKTFATAREILFKDDFEAYGVKYSIEGQNIVARASKGVIVSAGTVSTAKLLLLSGVGPEEHLEDVGIKPKIKLPVGENLQDHVSTGFDMVFHEKPLDMFYRLLSPLSHLEYFLYKSGVHTSVGVDALAFLNSDCFDSTDYTGCESEKDGRPDLEIIFMQAGVNTDHGYRFKDIVGIKDDVWRDYFAKFDKFSLNYIPVVLRPKSKGWVRLRDDDPSSEPLINPNYLSAEEDVDVLIRGIRFLRRFLDTEPMRRAKAEFNDVKFPRCGEFEFDSDGYWRCYVRYFSFTLYHYVGTCRMGGDDDERTVVTRDFRVKGTNRLFVVDGSVIPEMVSANTNAAIAMIAEKAADSIRYLEYLSKNRCGLYELFIEKDYC